MQIEREVEFTYNASRDIYKLLPIRASQPSANPYSCTTGSKTTNMTQLTAEFPAQPILAQLVSKTSRFGINIKHYPNTRTIPRLHHPSLPIPGYGCCRPPIPHSHPPHPTTPLCRIPTIRAKTNEHQPFLSTRIRNAPQT